MTSGELYAEPYDSDPEDAYCEGDPDPATVDWDAVARLQSMMDAVQAMPAGSSEKSWAMLGLLHEMHGDELEVL